MYVVITLNKEVLGWHLMI